MGTEEPGAAGLTRRARNGAGRLLRRIRTLRVGGFHDPTLPPETKVDRTGRQRPRLQKPPSCGRRPDQLKSESLLRLRVGFDSPCTRPSTAATSSAPVFCLDGGLTFTTAVPFFTSIRPASPPVKPPKVGDYRLSPMVRSSRYRRRISRASRRFRGGRGPCGPAPKPPARTNTRIKVRMHLRPEYNASGIRINHPICHLKANGTPREDRSVHRAIALRRPSGPFAARQAAFSTTASTGRRGGRGKPRRRPSRRVCASRRPSR